MGKNSARKRHLIQPATAPDPLVPTAETLAKLAEWKRQRGAEAAPAPRDERAARPALAPTPIDVDPGYPDDWRIRLRSTTRRIGNDRRRQRELVAQALAAGATWSAIGRELGVSRQTAHERFRHLDPRVKQAGQGA